MNSAEKVQLSSSSQKIQVQSWNTSDKGIEVYFVPITKNLDAINVIKPIFLNKHE